MIIRRKIERPEEDFPMAPMIDMVFLLLVFFMCVSTLARFEKSAPIDLPESGQSRVADNFQGRGILSLDKEGVVHIGPQTVARDDLPGYLRESLARNPALKIQLRADRQTPYADIKKVLQICAQTGAYEIIYSTYQSR